ncbi:MAG: hypothetical protein U5R14_06280 [Gemmatimonadota bacterium]|nr:hypothetical protein [Gemmatimonadota bacterium]
METAFDALGQILETEFDTDLNGWITDTVSREVWTKVRFVTPPAPAQSDEPSGAVSPERSAVLDFVDGFARFERGIRALMAAFLDEGQRFTGSTLDFSMKALSNAPEPDQALIAALPDVYRLRNRSVHGDAEPSSEEVKQALAVSMAP